MIYLDNAATTQIKPEVLEAMMPYLTYVYGNPGSVHQMGREAAKAVEQAREQVASFIGAKDPRQILFTSGGTEGNNLVFAGLEQELRRRGKTGVVISGIEHDSVWKAAHRLCDKDGFDLSVVKPHPDGYIDTAQAAELIDDHTGLVSVMKMNNETGIWNSLTGITSLAHNNGALFHTDCVQSAGVIPIRASDFDYDFVTVSSHKIHGPKGVGALYALDPGLLSPLIIGGDEQEYGIRGGTENVAGIVGFGKACELTERSAGSTSSLLRNLMEVFLGVLQEKLPYGTFRINGTRYLINGKTVSLCFMGIDAQTLLLALDANGVCVSAGSACRAHEDTPSRVLTAMGISAEDARCSIRVSFSDTNSISDAIDAADRIVSAVKVLGSAGM